MLKGDLLYSEVLFNVVDMKGKFIDKVNIGFLSGWNYIHVSPGLKVVQQGIQLLYHITPIFVQNGAKYEENWGKIPKIVKFKAILDF